MNWGRIVSLFDYPVNRSSWDSHIFQGIVLSAIIWEIWASCNFDAQLFKLHLNWTPPPNQSRFRAKIITLSSARVGQMTCQLHFFVERFNLKWRCDLLFKPWMTWSVIHSETFLHFLSCPNKNLKCNQRSEYPHAVSALSAFSHFSPPLPSPSSFFQPYPAFTFLSPRFLRAIVLLCPEASEV